MNLEQFRPPSKDSLQAIETQLRLVFAKVGMEPPLVRRSKNKEVAWQNEATRYYYLCVRRGKDPITDAQRLAALGAAAAIELQDIMDWDDGLPPGDDDAKLHLP